MSGSVAQPEPTQPPTDPPDWLTGYIDDVNGLIAFVSKFREIIERVIEDGRYIPKPRRNEVRALWATLGGHLV